MRVTIEIDKHIKSDEVVIRCKQKNDLIKKVVDYIEEASNIRIPFYQQGHECFIELNKIIFFETEDNSICAHTVNDVYYVRYKLYELENTLPKNFIRVSKSTIANINHIYSINKNITSSSLIEFNKTYKKVYVSRFYFKNLRLRLKERS